MAAEDVYDKIDEYFKIEKSVFAEVERPVTQPNGIIEIIRKREDIAARQTPFPPNQAIFLQGIYSHFLQKWLGHYKMNKNIFVVDNSELAEQPFNAMKNLESFLELSEFYQVLGSADSYRFRDWRTSPWTVRGLSTRIPTVKFKIPSKFLHFSIFYMVSYLLSLNRCHW